MYRNTIATFLIFSFSFSFGQSAVKNHVETQAQKISTSDPAAQDFSDLKVIGDAIGESSVVMLGEQDHGDAPTFLAKTRLIKYLVAEKGFSVIAFESDFYSLNQGWESVNADKDSIKTFLQKNIFSIWTNCKQADPLFTYLAENIAARKLEVSGFDNQHHGAYYQKTYYKQLFNFLDSSKLLVKGSGEEQHLSSRWNEFYKYLNSPGRVPDSIWNLVISSLDRLGKQSKVKYGEQHFWSQEIMSVKTFYEQMFSFERGIGYKGESIRDRQMAENLLWLARYKYPQQKIIVWAANSHVNKKALDNRINRKFSIKPMGEVFASFMPRETYVLGFTSSKGTAGRLGARHYSVAKTKHNSFESWMEKRNMDFAFVNFRDFTKPDEEFDMKTGLYHKYARADWANFFDGIFYIKDMFPCEPIK